MIERKIQSKRRYVLALIIGSLLFLLLILISYGFAYLSYARITEYQFQTASQLFEGKSSYTLFAQKSCSVRDIDVLSEDLAHQGRILTDLEDKFGKDNENIAARKRFYFALLLEHLDYVNLYKDVCRADYQTILFFYTNADDDSIEEGLEAGRVLDFVNSRRERLYIYSFDTELDSSIVEELTSFYGVSSTPSIVVNGETVLSWPFTVDDVERTLA